MVTLISRGPVHHEWHIFNGGLNSPNVRESDIADLIFKKHYEVGNNLMSLRFVFSLCAALFSSFAIGHDDHGNSHSNIIEEKAEPYYNMSFGLSPYFGILGLEIQEGKHSISIGIPETISYRYYFEPYQNTKFIGVFYSKWSSDEHDDYHNGFYYTDFESISYGLGIGYRWQWASGWNTTLSLSLYDYDDTYSNTSAYLEESGVLIFPGLNFGFKF